MPSGAILVNTLIGFGMELRATRAMEALQRMGKARVGVRPWMTKGPSPTTAQPGGPGRALRPAPGRDPGCDLGLPGAGIRVVMGTGDHVATARAIANEIDLTGEDEPPSSLP